MTKTARLGLRLEAELWAALKRAAAKDRRPVANMTRLLLEEALAARGFLAAPAPSRGRR